MTYFLLIFIITSFEGVKGPLLSVQRKVLLLILNRINKRNEPDFGVEEREERGYEQYRLDF